MGDRTSLPPHGARIARPQLRKVQTSRCSTAAPITLIDGEKLIDLMLEHDIGVQKRRVDLLEIEPSAFTIPEETEETNEA